MMKMRLGDIFRPLLLALIVHINDLAEAVVDYQCAKELINCDVEGEAWALSTSGTRYFKLITHTACTWADAKYFCHQCGGSLATLHQEHIDKELQQWEELLFQFKNNPLMEAWLGYKYDNLAVKMQEIEGQSAYSDLTGERQEVLDALDRKCTLAELDDEEETTRGENNCRPAINPGFLYMKRVMATTDLFHFFGSQDPAGPRKYFLCAKPLLPPTTVPYTGSAPLYTLFNGFYHWIQVNAQGDKVIGERVPQHLLTTTPQTIAESRDKYRFLHISIPSVFGILLLFAIIFCICRVKRPHDF